MNTAIIWDLDGTLLDSYRVIVESLYASLKEFGVEYDREVIHHYAIASSMKALIAEVTEKYHVPGEKILERYSKISGNKYLEILPMHHAKETLEKLEKMGVQHFVFTHRGKTTVPVLDNLGLTSYFQEILTSQSGFARKPEPEALEYLIKRHGLQRDRTYYVGDRGLDMQCAVRAGIAGILYLPEGSIDVSGTGETHIVHDLLDICNLV